MTVGADNCSNFGLYQLQAWIDYGTPGRFAFFPFLFFVYCLFPLRIRVPGMKSVDLDYDRLCFRKSRGAKHPGHGCPGLYPEVLSEDHYPHGNPSLPAGLLQIIRTWLSFPADHGCYLTGT